MLGETKYNLIGVAEEMGVARDTGESGTNFAEILSNALPPSSLDKKEKSSDSSVCFFFICFLFISDFMGFLTEW